MKSFAEKVVLITGGASGIGAALADAFLAAGAQVIICGRDEGRLAAARRQGVTVVACDVTDETQRAGLLTEVEQRFGRLDILVNNAGRMSHFDFRDAPLPARPIAEEIAVNLTAPILLTNLALPLLRRGEHAAVVMMGSGYGWVPAAHAPVYSAAKAGLRAFAKALRFQLEEAGVTVMEVVPPVVDTPATAHLSVPKVSAEQVASDTLRGLRRGAREVFVGRARAIPIGLRLAPRMMEAMVGRS